MGRAQEMKVLPIECKSGISGKMKSLCLFMRNKNLVEAVRCSLENFTKLTLKEGADNEVYRYVTIIPLYAVSNIISSKSMTPTC
jgi:hypothetical protein